MPAPTPSSTIDGSTCSSNAADREAVDKGQEQAAAKEWLTHNKAVVEAWFAGRGSLAAASVL